MNKILTLIFLSTGLAFGQVKQEVQLGGSNFIGASFNTAYEIPLSQNEVHRITPKIGVGYLPAFWGTPAFIFHTGLEYNRNSWNLGFEASSFLNMPFSPGSSHANLQGVSLIMNPNISYTFSFPNYTYLKLGTGLLLAFDEEYDFEKREFSYRYAGDAIPSLNITFGYRFQYQVKKKRFLER